MMMKNNIPHTAIFLFALALFGLSSCTSCDCPEDTLEQISAFKPENKYFKSSLVALHFKMETSPVHEVDSQFTQMIRHYKLPIDASGAKDGTYYGSSPYDAYDYRHEITLEIKEGKIIAADYNEVHKSGKGKEEDEEYGEEMSITGTTPAIAYPAMEKQLLETQDMMQVDAVSGASYSLQRFRYAVTIALIKAML